MHAPAIAILSPLVAPYLEILGWCRSTPTALAIRASDYEVTYGELETASRRLAHELSRRGVAPGDAVGVCFTARPEQLTAMLAVFRLGAVYVPLDPTHPPSLISYEVAEVQPRVVVTDRASSQAFDPAEVTLLDVDSLTEESEPGPLPDIDVPLDSVAYLFFTSGTTGKPKGVRSTHRNLTQYLRTAREAYGFDASDSFCSIARYTFSISMFELLSPLTVGGSVTLSRRDDVLRPEYLVALLDRVTVIHAGPSLLSRLSRYVEERHAQKEGFPALRHVSTGGDIVLPDVMERMKRMFPHAELHVIYGSTEINCMGTTYAIPRSAKCDKSIVGHPFPGVGVRLINEDRTTAAELGEICFSGPGLALGYLNRPEATDERFIDLDGVRHYRTGDLGRFDDDGAVEFLGRNDFQVQVRGMRVELIGIENTIRELRLADECATALRTFGENDERLVTFVQRPKKNPKEIRRALGEHLPDFMVPSHVVELDALPLTVNGKLDRKGLQDLPIAAQLDPPAQGQPAQGREAPSSLEKKITEVFANVLHVPSVGAEDDFFDLGGHSFLAIEAAELLENSLGVRVSPGDLFQAPAARSLVEHLGKERSHQPISLNSSTSSDRIFLIMGIHYFRPLAKRLENRFAAYGVYVDREFELLEDKNASVSVEALASRYVAIIRAEQAKGPYRLIGHSFGGLVAYEIAQQLRALGEEVALIGMLDTVVRRRGWKETLERVGRLAKSGPTSQWRWFGGRLNRVLAKLRSHPTAEFGRHEGGRFGQMEAVREEAYRRADLDYLASLSPITSSTTLILAGQRLEANPLEAPDGGWGAYLEGVDSHIVDADHLTMLEEPAVESVAQILLRACPA